MKSLFKLISFCLVVLLWSNSVQADPSKGKEMVKKITTTKRLSDFEVARYQYCGKDSDCTVANNGCCDCNNGGQDVAINKQNIERFRRRFDCDTVTCGMKMGEHPCGKGVISCVNHRCKYIGDVEFDAKGGELKR